MNKKGIIIIMPVFLLLYFAMNVELYSQVKYIERIIGSHDDETVGVFIDKKNTMVGTCSLDETIKLWSIPEGNLIRTLSGHLGQVNNLSFSGNDKNLASGSTDLTIRIWDVENGDVVHILQGHMDRVMGVYFSQDDSSTFVASTSFDKTVKLWDVRYGIEVKTLYGHTQQTNNIAYSYDGKYIASCSDDSTLKIWSTDLNSKEAIKTLTGHNAPVLSAIYSFDTKHLASCDENGYILIWSVPEYKLLRKIKAHTELIQDISFAEDNKTLLSGSLDRYIKLWNIETSENIFTLEVNSGVWSVDLVSDASLLIAGLADGSVRFYTKEVEKKKNIKKPIKKSKGGKK